MLSLVHITHSNVLEKLFFYVVGCTHFGPAVKRGLEGLFLYVTACLPGRGDTVVKCIPTEGGGLDTSLETPICDPPTCDPPRWWLVTEPCPRCPELGPRCPEKWREGGVRTVMERLMCMPWEELRRVMDLLSWMEDEPNRPVLWGTENTNTQSHSISLSGIHSSFWVNLFISYSHQKNVTLKRWVKQGKLRAYSIGMFSFGWVQVPYLCLCFCSVTHRQYTAGSWEFFFALD